MLKKGGAFNAMPVVDGSGDRKAPTLWQRDLDEKISFYVLF